MPGLANPPPASQTRQRWSDLRLRVLSAAVLAPLALAGLWLGGWAWLLLVAAATVGLALEWSNLCGGSVTLRARVAVLAAALTALEFTDGEQTLTALAILVAGAVLVRLLWRQWRLAAGVIYIGLAPVALVWLRADPLAGRANVLLLMLIVWSSDIGAYAVGRLVGGPKLAPAISPGKTWSGAVGGLLAALVAGWLTARSFGTAPAGPALLVAGGLSVVSQAGDLLESAIKRRFGVKDSSHLIPGHGGLLDRLDGLLTAAPAAALLVLWLGRGVVLWQ